MCGKYFMSESKGIFTVIKNQAITSKSVESQLVGKMGPYLLFAINKIPMRHAM